MGAEQIDRVARRLTGRRPVVGAGLGALLGLGGVAASDAKKHKKKPGPQPPPVCQAQPVTLTCAGKCGAVADNCGAATACACPDGQCCTGAGTCGSCIAFVSSSYHRGQLQGIDGADAICQQLATKAGLPGAYRAWLSNGTESPSTRFIRATVPYTRVDGTVVAYNWSDLTDGAITHIIDLTETGEDLYRNNQAMVWTNTTNQGTITGTTDSDHCNGWTTGSVNYRRGRIGSFGFQLDGKGWTVFTNSTWSCSEQMHLYCFQQR